MKSKDRIEMKGASRRPFFRVALALALGLASALAAGENLAFADYCSVCRRICENWGNGVKSCDSESRFCECNEEEVSPPKGAAITDNYVPSKGPGKTLKKDDLKK